MDGVTSDPDIANFDVEGSNEVVKPTFVGADPCVCPNSNENRNEGRHTGLPLRVYINDTQYFNNVPESAWNFYIGGYQPAQKWLKDRKGMTLTFDDIVHYQKIINVLKQTEEIIRDMSNNNVSLNNSI
jgi:hypothetical protein